MKQKLLMLVLLAFSLYSKAQVPTIGSSQGQLAIEYWSRAGNTSANGTNNVFGTKFDSPIYTVTGSGFSVTGNTFRSKMNGIYTGTINQYTINGYSWTQGVNTTGYMLIGFNSRLSPTAKLYDTKGAFSMLHLNGKTQDSSIQEFGYRPWMKTGITLTDNYDLSYVGLRQVGTAMDVTETTITWADNWGPPVGGVSSVGPDDLAFRFTTSSYDAGTGNTINTDCNSPYDLDGLHVARFSSSGLIGFGNTFGVNPTGTPANLYNRPQSLLHMSYQYRPSGTTDFEPYGFMQITYRRPSTSTIDTIGQGEQVTDGLRLGIDNQIFGSTGKRHLNGYLRWQEASSFIIQTEDNDVPNIESNERMRITSIGALRRNYTTAQYSGLNDSINVTRIGISHSGRYSLTKPKSLLHLGYDYGNPPTTNVQGYRVWMDLGMLVSNSRDHVYLGLLPRDTVTSTVTQNYERNDGVVAWGTDRNVTAPTQVDRFRFVFTGSVLDAVPEISPSNSWHGLEMMRMYPATVYKHPVYSPSGLPLDSIKAYGRVGIGDFTWSGVNEEPTQKLDVIGNGRFRYLPDSVFRADSLVYKYVMVDSAGVLRWGGAPFGTPCIDTLSSDFTSDRHVELNGYNFYFEADSLPTPNNNVGFGWECGAPLKAKVDVYQNGPEGIAGSFQVNAGNNSYPFQRTGVSSIVYGGPTYVSIGVEGQAITTGSDINIGVYGRAGGGNLDYSIYGNAGGTPDYAGYFNGDVQAGGTFISSDSTLKNDIQPIRNGLDIVHQLKPKTYYMDTQNYGQFNFSDQLQYGFLAQDVQEILPSAVKQSVQPGGTDENGNIVPNPTEFLALNYNAIIPINTQAIIDLDDKFEKATLSDESIKTNVQDLDGSLNKVLAMRGVSYDWNHNVHPELNLDSVNHVGFIAQEIAQIDPRLTYLADNDLLHVEYDKVVPILAEAIEELHEEVETKDSIIEDLNTRLTQLENCLSGILPYLCQLSQSAVQANTPLAQEEVRKNLNVTLSSRSTIVLDQNVPNPFAEQTIINFSIPATVVKAQIHFYDGNGKLIQSVDVAERGLGSLTVFGSDLSTGTYTYTLVADGVVVATKKMMKQ
jgi:hypothetical protein